jgi:hypothetical protein
MLKGVSSLMSFPFPKAAAAGFGGRTGARVLARWIGVNESCRLGSSESLLAITSSAGMLFAAQ